MGFYINPPNEDKKDFLEKHGVEVDETAIRALSPRDYQKGDVLPICLVFNEFFTTAAIVYGPSELEAFTALEDFRIKTFYLVPKEMLSKENGADTVPEDLLGA